jgi:hypothetical protein
MASLARLIVTMSTTSFQWMPQPCQTRSYHQINQLSLTQILKSNHHFYGADRKARALFRPIQLRLAASKAPLSQRMKALSQTHLLEAIYHRQILKSRPMRARLQPRQSYQQVSAAHYVPLVRHSNAGLYSRKYLSLGSLIID